MGLGDLFLRLRDDAGFVRQFQIDPNRALAGFNLSPDEESRLERLRAAIDGLDVAADLHDALAQLLAGAPAVIPTQSGSPPSSPSPGSLYTPPQTQPGNRPAGGGLTIPGVSRPGSSSSAPSTALPAGGAPRIGWRPGPDPNAEAPEPGEAPEHTEKPSPPETPHNDPQPPPSQPSSSPPQRAVPGHGPPLVAHPVGPGPDPSRDPSPPSAPPLNAHLGPDPSTLFDTPAGRNFLGHGPPSIGPGGRPPDAGAVAALSARVRATTGPDRRAALTQLVRTLFPG